MRLAGINDRQLAVLIGVNPSTIGRYLRGMDIKADQLFNIAKALDVDAKWLLTGRKGSKANKPTISPIELAAINQLTSSHTKRKRRDTEINFIPLHPEITNRYAKEGIYGIKISDTSMEPLISKGCLVAYKKEVVDLSSLNKRNNKSSIWCIQYKEDATSVIRKARFKDKDNYIEIIPINTMEYEIQHFRPRDVKILGRVIGIAWQDL